MNPEALMMVKDNRQLKKYLIAPYIDPNPNLTPANSSTGSYVSLGAPMKMVEMFYTSHGLPINEDIQWVDNKYSISREKNSNYQHIVPLNENMLSLHRLREPRFYAMIGADRTCWYRNTLNNKYEEILIENRQGEWGGTELTTIDESSKQNITGYWIKKWMYDEPLFKVVKGLNRVKKLKGTPEEKAAAIDEWQKRCCSFTNERVGEWEKDVAAAVRYAKDHFADFIDFSCGIGATGHSMGGAVAYALCQDDPEYGSSEPVQPSVGFPDSCDTGASA